MIGYDSAKSNIDVEIFSTKPGSAGGGSGDSYTAAMGRFSG